MIIFSGNSGLAFSLFEPFGHAVNTFADHSHFVIERAVDTIAQVASGQFIGRLLDSDNTLGKCSGQHHRNNNAADNSDKTAGDKHPRGPCRNRDHSLSGLLG